MSCHGTRTTQLVEVKLDKIIDYDDFASSTNHFTSKIYLFLRVWTLECTLTLFPEPKRRKWFHYKWNQLGIPYLGTFEWSGIERFPRHQYSGDYTERTDEVRNQASSLYPPHQPQWDCGVDGRRSDGRSS